MTAVTDDRPASAKVAEVEQIRLWRDAMTGDARATVVRADCSRHSLQHIVYHSPSGFNWGYGGSGPADLALSILAVFLPIQNSSQVVDLGRGMRVSSKAWDYHQRFKWEFVAKIGARGSISGDDVRAWISAEGNRRAEEELP